MQLYQQDSYIFFSIVFHCFGFEDSLYMGIGVPFVAFFLILFKSLDLKHFPPFHPVTDQQCLFT